MGRSDQRERLLGRDARGAMSRCQGFELQSWFALAALGLTGQAGVLARGSAHAPLDGRLAAYYLAAASYTIAAGTSDVQRNIIGSAVCACRATGGSHGDETCSRGLVTHPPSPTASATAMCAPSMQ